MSENDMDVDDFFADMMKTETKNIKIIQSVVQEKSVKHIEHSNVQPSSPQPSQTLEFEIKTAQEVLQNLQRDINCLSSTDRSIRKNAASKIKTLMDQCISTNRVDVLAYIYSHMDQSILNLFSDPIESIREVSVAIMNSFVTQLTADELGDSFTMIIPAINGRLTSRKEDEFWIEQSEEVRTVLNRLLTNCVRKFSKRIGHAHYTDSIVAILKSSFHDFHGIIKEASVCSITLCNELSDRINLFASILVKATKHNLTHNRSDVRVAVLQAIQYLMIHCKGNDVPLEDLDPIFHNMIMTDQTAAVREAFMEMVHYWVLHWIEYFTYRYHIVFYCLVGLTDEIAAINNSAKLALEAGGRIFIKDNEKEYEEMVEYERMNPNNYPERPPLSVRMLVRDVGNVKKIVDKLLADLFDWTIKKRVSASKALYALIVHTEEYITQHLEKLIPNYIQVCDDDEPTVKESTLSGAIQLTGRYVTPESYLRLISAYLRPQYSASPVKIINTLTVLTYLIRGKQKAFPNDAQFLQELGHTLGQSHLYENAQIKSTLMTCLESVISNASLKPLFQDPSISSHYFYLILGNDNVTQALANASDKSVSDLYEAHFEAVLDRTLVDMNKWDKTSANLQLFQALVTKSSSITLERYMTVDSRLTQVLTRHMNEDIKNSDPIVCLTLFAILNKLLADHGEAVKRNRPFLLKIMNNIVSPHLVWRNGPIHVEMRKAAMACMTCVLRQKMVQGEEVVDMLPHITSAIEEDAPHIRVITSILVADYLELTAPLLEEKQWKDWVDVITKQGLNDEIDQVRMQVAKASAIVLKYVQNPLRENLLSALFIHIDDESSEVRETVYKSLADYAQSCKKEDGTVEQLVQHIMRLKPRLLRATDLVTRLESVLVNV
jgi:hypothetical protein